MASELHVDAIKHSGGTSALTIDSSGNVHKAGLVVQTSFHTFSDQTTNASDSNVELTGSSHTFTPKFASSLLIISFSVSVQFSRSNTNQGCTINVVVDSSNISHASEDYENYLSISVSGVNNYVRTHKEVSTSASNTNTKTIKLVGRPYATGDSGQMVVNKNGNFISSIKIQEIAQ